MNETDSTHLRLCLHFTVEVKMNEASKTRPATVNYPARENE